MSDDFSVNASALREVVTKSVWNVINKNMGDCRKLHTEKLYDLYFSPAVSG
jgi:hypothetical protein